MIDLARVRHVVLDMDGTLYSRARGSPRETMFVSGTQLRAVILASDIAAEGSALLTVANSVPNPSISAAQPFAVMSSAPVPNISAATVSALVNGEYPLLLIGTGFTPESEVSLVGCGLLTTTYLSPWQLSAMLPCSLTENGDYLLEVTNQAGDPAYFRVEF